MSYEELLIEAQELGLIVKEKPLKANKGRILGNKIAIKNDISKQAEKKCILAEEIGHFKTNAGNILDQSQVVNRKQEKLARNWAYEKLVSFDKLIEAFNKGVRSKYELACYLEVTEEFLHDAIIFYGEKYGEYHKLDNYIIQFNPLSIIKSFDIDIK